MVKVCSASFSTAVKLHRQNHSPAVNLPCTVVAEYAQVLRMLGNGRLEAMCIDGTKRLCHIRGKMRKKVWVNTVSKCNVTLHVQDRFTSC